jgi:hypothetical protein
LGIYCDVNLGSSDFTETGEEMPYGEKVEQGGVQLERKGSISLSDLLHHTQ